MTKITPEFISLCNSNIRDAYTLYLHNYALTVQNDIFLFLLSIHSCASIPREGEDEECKESI